MRSGGDERADEELLAAARGGDERAFAVLYERHRARALRTASRARPHAGAPTAEDVVHAAFAEVWRALRNGRGPVDELGPYLTVVVRRIAWRAPRPEPDVGVVDPGGSSAVGPFGHEGHVLLREAFAALPSSQRRVLWMAEVEGRSVAEVAATLRVAPAAASSARYRARRSLVRTYVAACRARAPEGCERSLDELAERLLTGRSPSTSGRTAGSSAHADGCRWCQDVARGIDLVAGD